MINYSTFELPNKLRVLFFPRMEAQSFYVSLIGKAGRRAEEDDEIGAAHFLEHLLFDGTVKRPTTLDILDIVEKNGADKNGHTYQEYLEYWIKILPDKAEAAFDFISDIFTNSLLREEDIEKERKVIIQEALSRKDDPSDILERFRLSTLYPRQGIGRTIYDEEKNLNLINRSVLTEYRDRNYSASNWILVLSGNMKDSEVRHLSEKYFKHISVGKEVIYRPSKFKDGGALEVINKDVNQSQLSISFRGVPTASPLEPAISLMTSVLSGGMSTRLQIRLREELHLVYSVWAYLSAFSDTGFVTIETGSNEDKLQRIVDEVFQEINKLLNNGVTDGELEKGKNILLSGLLFPLQKIEFIPDIYGWQWLLLNKIQTLEEELEKIKALTKDDIKKAAEYVFSDKPKINILTKNLKALDIPTF